MLSINTLNWYLQSTSQSILNRHPYGSLVNTWSTLDQQSVDSRPSVNRLICTDRKSVDSRPTVNWEVDGVSMECQPRCQWSVDRILIEFWLSVNREYWLRVSNDTWLQMPSVHMIQYSCLPVLVLCLWVENFDLNVTTNFSCLAEKCELLQP